MPKLSVVIITFNEEKNIARCIDSVKPVADEIVVLDSYSTDATREICEGRGALFFQHKFDGHIEQKNRAIMLAKYPHILSLDADEALDETLQQSILQIKQDWQKEGYYMNRLTNYCGHWVRHSHWYPDKKLRLSDSRKGHWTGENPHDKYELFSGDKQAGRLKGNILHYSYDNTRDHYKQIEYFTNIAAEKFFLQKRKAPRYKLIVNPLAKFLDHFIFHLGFLDGKTGYQIAKISAYATWLKYKKIRNLYKNAGA
jgi:glycosyltransferase involved in cell wall biosynthesis